MKKALVMTVVLVLGLGLAAFAGLLEGSWKTTIGVDPGAQYMTDFFVNLDSTLAVDYTIGGFTFGSSSTFDLDGYSNQEFTVSGLLGAFTLSSTMTFAPMAVVTKTYPELQTSPTTCHDWDFTTTTEPKFLKWTAEGSVSIAGVEFGGYFLLDQSHDNVKVENMVWQVINDTIVQTDSYVCTSKKNGAGARLKLAGSFGGASLTSYTYFNLKEKDVSTKYCPAVGKSGTFSIVNADCHLPFYEEYLLLEGVGFGCVTLDAGLSILCSGFADLTVVLSDIIICDWLNMDFGITFTTDSKAVDLCMNLICEVKNFDCITVELSIGDPVYQTTYVIDAVTVHGVGLTYTWNGIEFSSYTELDAYSALFSGATTWTFLNSPNEDIFIVPWVGYLDCGTIAACCVDDVDATYATFADGFWTAVCFAEERFKLWEKFVIDIDADACCGGLFDLTIATFFGNRQQLDSLWYGWYAADETTITHLFTLVGTDPTQDDIDDLVLDEALDEDDIYIFSGYEDVGTQDTLFAWAKTEVDASIGVGSNITLTAGFDVSAYGWDKLEFGFEFTF